MQTLGDMREHFLRVVKMSGACGVNLSAALDERQIDAPEYADMVTRCRGWRRCPSCQRRPCIAKTAMNSPNCAACRRSEVSAKGATL
jgi:hypothetical protein